MIVKLFNRITAFYLKVVSSLGFWPTIITVAYAVAAGLLVWLDTDKITTALLESFPALVIKDGDTARVILSTVVGGLVSLTVFSFTMVMAQLNRAATSYSPRLLPGLISTKSHQVVLGTFLGGITFCLIVLITIEPSDDSYELPGLAILIAVGLSIGCLGTFVYFIHSISQAIQVTNILQRVANDTADRLRELSERDERNQHKEKPDFETAQVIKSSETGYFQGCNSSALASIAKQNDLVLEVVPLHGEFVLENTQLVRLSKEVDDETAGEMKSCFRFSGSAFVRDNYVLGFKQITEIAVRAMSPGTNDPGTALTAIDHLTHLIFLRSKFDDEEIHFDDDSEPRAIIAAVSFSELMYPLLASLRQYCKHDIVIVQKLLQMFDYLFQQPIETESHRETLKREVDTLISDARDSIESEADLKILEQKIKALSCETSSPSD
ncbi:MAG: DUF2254 domain-containing protein [Verrucomicrobiales bacterium]|nr:DUF2254 domain-containing protein [Verrucomicrobiales bacterium]